MVEFIDAMRLKDIIHVKDNALEALYFDWEKSKGELIAGNDNPQILKDLKAQTLKLMSLRKGLTVLAQLNM